MSINHAEQVCTREIQPENLPQELKSLKQWVNWAALWSADKKSFSKPPMKANGRNASSTEPGDWTTLEESLAALGRNGVYRDRWGQKHQVTLDGIGLAGLERTDWVGVDLDGCVNPETGEINAAARGMVKHFDSYTEISPSGKGLRIWVEAEKHRAWCANKGGETDIEVYDKGRFLTATGWHLEGTPWTVEKRQEALDAFMERHAPPPECPETERRPYTGPQDYAYDLEGLLDKAGVVFKQASDATSERTYHIVCPWAHEHSGGDTSGTRVGQYASGAPWFHCDHAHCAGRRWEQFREELEPEAYRKVEIIVGGKKLINDREEFNPTDLGNASRLVAHHGDDLRYCYPWRTWLIWDGRRWARDESGEIHRRAKRTVREIYREAADEKDDNRRAALGKHAKASEAENRIQAMISLAKSEVPIMPAAMDRDPWLLNVGNGTVDLRTGELREHRRGDLITKLAGEYDPEASTPTWTATLERVLPSAEVRAFFKRLCGHAISGDVSEHVLPILYGTGANGKSTVLNALLEAAGEYGMQAAPDLLIAKRGAHPTEVADLFGMRFVTAIEVEDGARLAESLVKTLTGGDRVRARRMRQDFWEFDPTHKVFMAVNHKPQVRGNDNSIWRRIRLIPFEQTIPPAEQDKKLPEKLRAELPGILAWAVQGCLEWRREGLKAPDEVRKATGGYRKEMDTLAAFFDDRCVLGEQLITPSGHLYKSYQMWCGDAGEHAETQKMLSMRLTERGFVSKRLTRGQHKGRKAWLGIGLRVNDPEPDDPDDGDEATPYASPGAEEGSLTGHAVKDASLEEKSVFAGKTPDGNLAVKDGEAFFTINGLTEPHEEANPQNASLRSPPFTPTQNSVGNGTPKQPVHSDQEAWSAAATPPPTSANRAACQRGEHDEPCKCPDCNPYLKRENT